ncbi:hypothetical protein HN587_04275 [Candidatus Woesearchaeota archaeon]|jgi:tRNA U34 5-methylaminomethyl-2-thiouridine-forming methyltransferase MnmC|nr:hypothetical protein [Candidatus Woesearchaeota archaeon]
MDLKKIKTNDGSITFHNSEYDETYHSNTGAEEEALKKFVEPSKLEGFSEVKILDFCFGLGYNSACAIDYFKGAKIEIVGLENDEKILNEILNVESNFKCYSFFKKLVTLSDRERVVTFENCKIKLIVDDACKSIIDLEKNSFDLVYFDPFSPKKCPELWTEEVFSQVYRVLKKGGRLMTYSCASAVRKGLKTVGFEVIDGPCVGRRSPSTIAIKK